MCGKGTEVPQDRTKGVWFLKLAADQGYQPARDLLVHLAEV